MGRREGTVDARVCVAVSSEMGDLRRTQTALNRFLWPTELSYNYVLAELPKAFRDTEQPAADALSNLRSTAWYKNNQGRIKYAGTIGQTVTQVRENTPYIYRTVLVYFASAFEDYLDRRLARVRPKARGGGWGPYSQSLALPALMDAPAPLQLKDVIAADVCRWLRNRVIHPPFELPSSTSDENLTEFRSYILADIQKTSWWDSLTADVVKNSVGQLIGQAANHKKQAEKTGWDVPIELFYSLFNFTCLDTMAFQIEEALIPKNTRLDGYAWRTKEDVRRTDLIIEPGEAV